MHPRWKDRRVFVAVLGCAVGLLAVLTTWSTKTQVVIHADDSGVCVFVAYRQTKVFGQGFGYTDGKPQTLSCRDVRAIGDVSVLCDCGGIAGP